MCHGVIRRIAPAASIIDVAHGIPPQAVLQGALALADALPYLPIGVHVAVVDPDVGGNRRAVALRDRDGRLLVGPDNGLLALATAERGGVEAAVELVEPAYRLHPVSDTFHARDVFCPAAAHLASGVDLDALGPAVDPATLARLALPVAFVGDGEARGPVLGVDTFGNATLGLRRADLKTAGLHPGTPVELVVGGRRASARVARTYADVEPGALVVYESSFGRVEVAVSRGDAASRLGLEAGTGVVLRRGA
ncbi:MAG: SAM-dependent chlorinase/fluorinase [Thermoleophilia bacterium]